MPPAQSFQSFCNSFGIVFVWAPRLWWIHTPYMVCYNILYTLDISRLSITRWYTEQQWQWQNVGQALHSRAISCREICKDKWPRYIESALCDKIWWDGIFLFHFFYCTHISLHIVYSIEKYLFELKALLFRVIVSRFCNNIFIGIH